MRKLLGVLAVAIKAFTITVIAGTLENAPFHLVLPNDGWKLDDSVAQQKGDGVYLMATMINTNTGLISCVAKAEIKKTETNAFDELCDGLRDSFSENHVKVLSDKETIFLGYKARHFAYEINLNKKTIYNEVVVFVTGNAGWTIGCMGQLNQKTEVKQMFTFYQKNKN